MFLNQNLPLVLQALHAHDICVGIRSRMSGGWLVWIGDDYTNICIEEKFDPEEFNDIPQWLLAQANQHYPYAASRH